MRRSVAALEDLWIGQRRGAGMGLGAVFSTSLPRGQTQGSLDHTGAGGLRGLLRLLRRAAVTGGDANVLNTCTLRPYNTSRFVSRSSTTCGRYDAGLRSCRPPGARAPPHMQDSIHLESGLDSRWCPASHNSALACWPLAHPTTADIPHSRSSRLARLLRGCLCCWL